MFNEIARIVPPGKSGNVEIRHWFQRRSTALNHAVYGLMQIPRGKYAVLLVDGVTMMGEGQAEWVTSRPIIENARGNVLIAGLGLGMILPPILSNPKVDSVTVVEKSKHVFKLVEPHYRHPKLTVECLDIHRFCDLVWSRSYDAIWLDIWPDVSVKNLPEIAKLKKRVQKFMNADSWLGVWVEDYLVEEESHGGCCKPLGNGTFVCAAKHCDPEDYSFLDSEKESCA